MYEPAYIDALPIAAVVACLLLTLGHALAAQRPAILLTDLRAKIEETEDAIAGAARRLGAHSLIDNSLALLSCVSSSDDYLAHD
uniref:Uncharacterized protein n=1 Tax=Mycena chlorophos TaxID=658473 RepID=A0ABQ0LG58_MYCCL|nr:predicted protein [Mycena chlorophos]